MSLSDEDKSWIREQLERIETNFVSELHKLASPAQAQREAGAPNGSAE